LQEAGVEITAVTLNRMLPGELRRETVTSGRTRELSGISTSDLESAPVNSANLSIDAPDMPGTVAIVTSL